ncbi:MAG: hypothetical protein AAB874_02495, partial [Patescibacteria group bacterium]
TDGSGNLSWAANGFDPTTTVEIMEEFVGSGTTSGTIGTNGWDLNTNGSGAVRTATNPTGRIGVIGIGSGTSAGSGILLSLREAQSQTIFYANIGNITSIFSFKNTQAAHIDSTIRAGYFNGSNANTNPTSGAYFRATGTGNWYAVTRASDVETATDTGIPQATTYKAFKILSNSGATNFTFYIDGVLKATHTTNLPTVLVYPVFQVHTNSTTDFNIDIDYFYLKVTGLSRADIAENYSVEDLSIESGDLVRIKKDQNSLTEKYVIEKTSKPYDSQMIGAISTEPMMVMGEKGKENLRPVALVGRVPVKVTTKNGDISAGDYLTSSDIPGVVMKATEPGMTIGKALESYSSASE